MYLITAIIESTAIANILEDLKASDIEGFTLTQVKGEGGFVESIQDTEEHTRLDIVVCNDHFKELAMEAIRDNARNYSQGSGKVWVIPVVEVERIRTGEKNEDALCHSAVEMHVPKANEEFTHEDTPSS